MNNKRGGGIVTLVIVLAVICIVFLAAGFSLMAAWNGGWDFWKEIPENMRNIEEFSINQVQEHEISGINKFEFGSVSADMDIIFADTDSVKVELKGSYRSSRGNVELKMDKIGNTVRIYVEYPKLSGMFNWNETKLTITMPMDMGDRDLRFTTVSGDIDIPAGMKAGEISTHSTSGDVQVFDVECENFFSGNVSGRLELAGTITGDIRIESVSGDAEINSYVELDKVYVTSVSGDVDIYVDKDLDFKFTFDTVSGDFNCSFPIYESGGRNDRKGYTDESADMDFDINTVSGDLRIRN